MIYRFLADLVVLAHFSYIVFVIFGAALAFRWKKAMWVHIPAALWAALLEFAGWVCPLTPLELWFRTQGQAVAYSEGFIEHYILLILYPPGLTREIQLALGVFVVAVNVLVYGYVFTRRH